MKDGFSAPSEELEKLQKIIDIDKWLASEKAGRDLCGEASYCACCVKAETYPCAPGGATRTRGKPTQRYFRRSRRDRQRIRAR